MDYTRYKIMPIGESPDRTVTDSLKRVNSQSGNMYNQIINDYVTTSVYEAYYGAMPRIEKVIFNNPATIVFWKDGTKTVVKAEHEEFDHEKGLAMAIAKRALGGRGKYYNEFRKWLNASKED